MTLESGHLWELLVVPERHFIKVQVLILQQTGDLFLKGIRSILLCQKKLSEQKQIKPQAEVLW